MAIKDVEPIHEAILVPYMKLLEAQKEFYLISTLQTYLKKDRKRV